LSLLIRHVCRLELHHILNKQEYTCVTQSSLSFKYPPEELLLDRGNQISELQGQHDEEQFAEFLDDLVDLVAVDVSLELEWLPGLVHDVHVAQVVHHVAPVDQNLAQTFYVTVLEIVRLLLLYDRGEKQFLERYGILDEPEAVLFLIAFHVFIELTLIVLREEAVLVLLLMRHIAQILHYLVVVQVKVLIVVLEQGYIVRTTLYRLLL
jgi:hypothetical protein